MLFVILFIAFTSNLAGECTVLSVLETRLTDSSAAQSSPLSVVCIAGQCIQGISNTTRTPPISFPVSRTLIFSIVGAKLSAPNAPTSLHLLPGTYSTSTNPQLLHNLLTSSSASLSPSPGFENASQAFSPSSLSFELRMSPGMTVYDGARYSGQAAYSGFPETPSASNDTAEEPPTQVTAASFALSDNTYAIVGGSGNDRVVIWTSVPDTTQLPFSSSSSSLNTLSVFNIQSSTCNPTCSGNSICSPTTNQCICAPGFTGSSCESCAPGFFGPNCQPCPGGCDQCDEGIQGTGRCLKKTIVGKPEDCGCVNGQCGNNGQCVCSAGWKDGSDGKKCSTCQDGFFLTSSGECQVCQSGCSKCADTTGSCVQCQQDFSLNTADNTKCDLVQKPTSSGQVCPDGSFSNGSVCSPCSTACKTCTGPTSNNCALCAPGTFMFDGNCVGTNGDGVCEGTTGMVGNNLKGECDSCPSKCTSCKIPGFSVASTIDQLQCTGCLSGFVLSQGKCVDSCPAGTFLSPQDNLNCIPCDSSCSTCSDSAPFCLTCSGSGQLAFNGKCVSSCPTNTFTSNSSSCQTCHSDCASCSGGQFNQCTSCPASRPVLKDGRCLTTCAKGQFFDKSSSSCNSCDSSCSTCSASGDDKCLSCSDGEVLRQGKCVKSDGGCETLSGLGVCLSELVAVPQANPTSDGNGPTPSITGISDPTKIEVKHNLEWWQIVLMVLGCLFLAAIFVILWRRHARKKRMERTKAWATERGVLGGKGGSWWRRMFARRGARGGYTGRTEKGETLPRYRDEVDPERPESTVDGFIDAYADERVSREAGSRSSFVSRSLFSEITGERRKAPEPRMLVKEHSMSAKSLRTTKSAATRSTASTKRTGPTAGGRKHVNVETEAERYARSVREQKKKKMGGALSRLTNTPEQLRSSQRSL
ncbi:Extracellular matrix protein FRAS1 [Leucoagaricus sp. SymC.cos]|nr:Extracellular matrix protein FRAS1 [Leucoagaricus sp. SymC.cos]